jgi:tRNA synthetases class I (I, L, M and V)/Protein of unknown function (DUF835)/Anticodon-binding domain of tRNA ligase
MAVLSERPDPKLIEPEARAIWRARRLPPLEGPVGPGQGPVVHQFEGSFAPQESGMLLVQRVVAADVDARALMITGRRAAGVLRKEEGGPITPNPKMDPLIAALGVWVGGPNGQGWDNAPRRGEVQTLVGRLAHQGALAVRDVSLRICPACAVARDPERIVYQEEGGETLLVRFPFVVGDQTVSALVWTDAAWRLLGTSALMVHPDLPYVVARYRRHGAEELVFTSKSSLDRIRGWLPGADLEVLEEHPGRHWEGQSYIHPLRHQFPMGGSMTPPGGTILPVVDVGDSGTGVVPLVPGHGGTDALIAERLGVPGWPLITPKGRFDILLVHKYAGLELESGSEFVVRDLAEEGAIFAQLRVRRGVPHCSRCGTALIWAPGRAWCLEPSRLPEEKVSVYRTLLPHDRPIEKLEAVPWPISEPSRSDDPQAVSLLECTSCDRLEGLGKEAERCPCGGRRRAVRRRLLPAFDGAAAAWAGLDPFPTADSSRLYVNERRRAPAVVHHVAAMSGVGGTVGEVRLTILPTVPEADVAQLIEQFGADAVRAALVRAQASEGATATLPQRCVQEQQRLARFWMAVREIVARIDGPSLSTYGQPIAGFLGELEPEDRALLARFERLRIQCLADYDRAAPALVHRRLFRFLDNDLVLYRRWVAPRLELPGTTPSKRAALRTLVHIASSSVLLLGPIAPHLSEATHRVLRRDRASLFEETVAGVEQTLLDENRVRAWDRWATVVRAVDRFRRGLGLPAGAPLTSVVLVLGSDPLGDEYRAEVPTLERLAQVEKVEIGSPGTPWAGRRRQLRPVESEIQRVYSSRAAQIIHLLRRMPERKWADPASGQEFSMMVNGQPTRILPSMVAWSETLPERYVPAEWSAGELYAEVPAGRELPPRPPPPLSPDAFRVVTRVAHRMRSSPTAEPRVAIVAAPAPLAVELSAVAVPLAAYLGLQEFRVVESERVLPRHGLIYGRTKSGTPWSFHVGGATGPAHENKTRPVRIHGHRVRPAFTPGDLAPTVLNYADEDLMARAAGIRVLGEELDEILGAPILGPSKVAAAWEVGLRSVDAFRQAPWSTLVALPGFGVPVASALVTKFGGTVPPRPPRTPKMPKSSPGGGVGRGEPSGAPHPREDVPILSPPPVASASPRPSVPVAPPATMSVTLPPRAPAPPRATIPPATPSPGLPTAPSPAALPPPNPPPAVPTESAPNPAALPAPDSQTDRTPAAASVPDTATADSRTEAPFQDDEVEDEPDADETESPALPSVPPQDSPPAESPTEAPVPIESPEELTAEESEPGEFRPDENPPVALGSDDVPPPRSGDVARDDPTGPEFATAPPTPTTDETDASDDELAPPPPTEPAWDARESPVTALESRGGDSSGDSPPTPTAEVASPEEPLPLEGEGRRSASSDLAMDEPTHSVPPAPGPAEPESEPVQSPPPPVVSTDSSVSSAPVDLPPPLTGEADLLSVEPSIPELLPVSEPSTALPILPTAPPAPPEPPSGVAPVPAAAPSGGIEIVVGTSYVPTLERFLEATAAGHQGICVVRDSPERVRAYVGTRPVEIRWLTNIGRGPTLKPTDLEGFSAFLAHAISTSHATALFLEGIEYLVRLHGLELVVQHIVALDQLARAHSARVWVPLNPKLLSSLELDRFVSMFGARAPSS